MDIFLFSNATLFGLFPFPGLLGLFGLFPFPGLFGLFGLFPFPGLLGLGKGLIIKNMFQYTTSINRVTP